MTDREIIRAEIERRIQECKDSKIDSSYYDGLIFAFEEVRDFINSLPEEPVSEDLEEAGKQYLERSNPDRVHQITNAFKAGAQWQKEQFEKNRLKHCNSITNEQAELEQGFIDQHLDKYNRMPTFLDAIEYGTKLQEQKDDKDESDMLVIAHMDGVERGKAIMKQQMMKGAFIPGFKSIEFKLGEEYTFNSKNFDMEKAKAYGAKEGDTIIGYFIKKED